MIEMDDIRKSLGRAFKDAEETARDGLKKGWTKTRVFARERTAETLACTFALGFLTALLFRRSPK